MPSYCPYKTIYNCFVHRCKMGVSGRNFVALATGGGDTDEIKIDATHFKAQWTAASLIEKGRIPGLSDAHKVDGTRNDTLLATRRVNPAPCF